MQHRTPNCHLPFFKYAVVFAAMNDQFPHGKNNGTSTIILFKKVSVVVCAVMRSCYCLFNCLLPHTLSMRVVESFGRLAAHLNTKFFIFNIVWLPQFYFVSFYIHDVNKLSVINCFNGICNCNSLFF